MTDLTDIEQQAAQMRAVAALTEAAIGFGATAPPMWTFYSGGSVHGAFNFDTEPADAVMDPWRLAIGRAYRTTVMPYTSAKGPAVSHAWTFRYQGVDLELSVNHLVTAGVVS